MSKAKRGTTQHYSNALKAQLIAKGRKIIGSGKPMSEAARQMGVTYVTAKTWLNSPVTTPASNNLISLSKQLLEKATDEERMLKAKVREIEMLKNRLSKVFSYQ